jgi:hypothetical protein
MGSSKIVKLHYYAVKVKNFCSVGAIGVICICCAGPIKMFLKDCMLSSRAMRGGSSLEHQRPLFGWSTPLERVKKPR